MINTRKEVNMEMKGARQRISKIAAKFKSECTQMCVSRRAWRQGGRILRREMERKGCDVEVTENSNVIRLIYKSKKKLIGMCFISRLNWDPESFIMNPKKQIK